MLGYTWCYISLWFVCFAYSHTNNIFSYLAAVSITGDRASNRPMLTRHLWLLAVRVHLRATPAATPGLGLYGLIQVTGVTKWFLMSPPPESLAFSPWGKAHSRVRKTRGRLPRRKAFYITSSHIAGFPLSLIPETLLSLYRDYLDIKLFSYNIE
jgi:hypothetical protein